MNGGAVDRRDRDRPRVPGDAWRQGAASPDLEGGIELHRYWTAGDDLGACAWRWWLTPLPRALLPVRCFPLISQDFGRRCSPLCWRNIDTPA